LVPLALLCTNTVVAATTDLLPSIPDVAYGPDPKQTLDIYLPSGAGPFPVFFWIHGGGWRGGDKVGGTPNPGPYLQAGCAVVSVNYRLLTSSQSEVVSLLPFDNVLSDNRRSLQFVRQHAVDWHLDPVRIVVAGSSAGAVSALYLGCAGDTANAQSADPLERVSTKVAGIAAEDAQTSMDPQRVREWVPGMFDAHSPEAPLFEQFLAHREKLLPQISKYSPDFLLTKAAPPIYFSYGHGMPASDSAPSTAALLHSPLWGVGFQKLAQARGVECYLQYPGHPAEKYGSISAFTLHQLGLSAP